MGLRTRADTVGRGRRSHRQGRNNRGCWVSDCSGASPGMNCCQAASAPAGQGRRRSSRQPRGGQPRGGQPRGAHFQGEAEAGHGGGKYYHWPAGRRSGPRAGAGPAPPPPPGPRPLPRESKRRWRRRAQVGIWCCPKEKSKNKLKTETQNITNKKKACSRPRAGAGPPPGACPRTAPGWGSRAAPCTSATSCIHVWVGGWAGVRS